MTPDEAENRRLLQIEAKHIRLERLLIDLMMEHQAFCGKLEEIDKYFGEMLK